MLFGESYVEGAVVPDDMPEELLENEHVKRLVDNAVAVIDSFEEWIDPNSEHYAELLSDTSEEAVYETKEAIAEVLREAVYREKLHGESVSLTELLDKVEGMKIEW